MSKIPRIPDGPERITNRWRNELLRYILLPFSITVTATGPTDNVDVKGVSTVVIDASSNSVTIGGFVNGLEGQIIRLVRIGTANNAILEHNESTGNQDIFLADEADQTLTTYGGWTLYCNGTHWYEIGY